ncbi:MAG: MAPEG family protein [Candidatus Puniceispirillaceae bacterium]
MITPDFPMITSLYASLLALFFILLSLRVIALRGNPLFAVLKRAGDDRHSLERAIRGHGNFAEYTPIMLVLMLIAEQSGGSATLLHSCGAMFLFGRLAHGFCFGFMKHSMPLRTGGMVLTLAALGSMAIAQLLALL